MARLIIQIPETHHAEILQAVAAKFGVPSSFGGLKQHVINHLKDTVRDQRQVQAANQVETSFSDGTWDDLEDQVP